MSRADREAKAEVDCFGEQCVLAATGPDAKDVVAETCARLASWGRRFWRENDASEVAQLNASPRRELLVSPLMARLVEADARAFRATDGLVDASLADQLDAIGGTRARRVTLAEAVRRFPPRAPAHPRPRAIFPFEVDRSRGLVTRRAGAKLDSAEITTAVIADVCAEALEHQRDYLIDCAGTVRLGGREARTRMVRVVSPFSGETLHEFRLAGCGVATDGVGTTVWLDGGGRPIHRLVDPTTGRPAFTGIVQVTAIARTSFEAAVLARAAALSGPARASQWLRRGGLVVFDDASRTIIPPGAAGPARRPAATAIKARVRDSWPR